MENTSLGSYLTLSNGLPLPLNQNPWKQLCLFWSIRNSCQLLFPILKNRRWGVGGLLFCSSQRKDVFERHSLSGLLSKASTPKRDWSGLSQSSMTAQWVLCCVLFQRFYEYLWGIWDVLGIRWPLSLPNYGRPDLLFGYVFPFCFSRKIHKDGGSVPSEAQKPRSFEDT